MTISTTQNQVSYTGDGASTAFAFPYPFIATSDLKFYLDGEPQTTGFSVSGVAPTGGSGTFASGTLTTVAAPSAGQAVLIYCDPDQLQGMSLPPNDPFPSKTVEKALDKVTLLIQRIYTKFGNAITFPVGDTANGVLPASAVRANTVLSFDERGNAVAVAPSDGSATSLALFLLDAESPVKGAAMVGFQHPGAGAVARTTRAKLLERVSVLDFIPLAEHDAIMAGTSTYDATGDFNAALAAAHVVHVPAGGYRTRRPINMTARRNGAGNYTGRSLIGEGAANTIINAYTGNYPCLDLTGSSNCTVQGINFRSDNPPSGLGAADCASIGIVLRRGSTTEFTQNCHQPRLIDLRFNLTSSMSRNGGTGTVGVLNCGSEHVVTDQLQVYANLPLVAHNTLQFEVSNSSDIPVYGAEYEPPYAGSPISTTVAEWRSMQLIAWDSFRAMWLYQVANYEFPALYTSTRKLVSSTPAYAESFHVTSSANLSIECYQETSGLFGATYRMDHRYLTLGGDNEGIDIKVQRGALDVGFSDPGVSASSVHLLDATYLANSEIDCNYTIGIYNASGDNNGFALYPVTYTGSPNRLANVKFTLDRGGSHSADINGAGLGAYSVNVESVNYLSGEAYLGNGGAVGFTPVVFGTSGPGTASYSIQEGLYVRNGRTVTFTLRLAWTGHTGSGFMRIGGLPFISAPREQIANLRFVGLNFGSGKHPLALLPATDTAFYLVASDLAGGAETTLNVAAAVTNLVITGSYMSA